MKKTLFALFITVAAFAATAQTQAGNMCLPGQGCNDPNAQQVDAKLPDNGVQAPPKQTIRTTQQVDVIVDKQVDVYEGTTVVINHVRSTCVNMSGTACGTYSQQQQYRQAAPPSQPVYVPQQAQQIQQVSAVASNKCNTFVSKTATHVVLKTGQHQLIANHNQYRASCGCPPV